MLFYCWPTVFDVGPTLKQHCFNISCLLGTLCPMCWCDSLTLKWQCRPLPYLPHLSGKDNWYPVWFYRSIRRNAELTMAQFIKWISLGEWHCHLCLTFFLGSGVFLNSHTLLWFSLWDVYRYQPISHSICRLSTMYGSLVYVWLGRVKKYKRHFSCDMWKYSTCSMNKVSPKGSHLIYWTSAVFSHIALKCTLFAYLIYHSFKAVLANAIASFKLQENMYIFLVPEKGGEESHPPPPPHHSKHEMLNQCWLNVEYSNNISSTSRVCSMDVTLLVIYIKHCKPPYYYYHAKTSSSDC